MRGSVIETRAQSPMISTWNLLKEVECVEDWSDRFHPVLYSKATLPKAITSYFLTLIPNNKNPIDLEEYKPICLVDNLYKILSKILASRLNKFIGNIISLTQCAFITGRPMLDGVLVANELIDFVVKSRKSCKFLKVDFEKAYDNVSWNFLKSMLRKFGFGDKWSMWMEACVFSSHMSILVKGIPTKEIKVERRLRQGGPFSPFLFVLVVEGLTRLVKKALDIKEYLGLRVSTDISHEII